MRRATLASREILYRCSEDRGTVRYGLPDPWSIIMCVEDGDLRGYGKGQVALVADRGLCVTTVGYERARLEERAFRCEQEGGSR
jgi:hypothetical protein